MTEIDDSTIARFWAKVDKNGPLLAHVAHLGACWMWTASRDPFGYGRIRHQRRLWSAHRLAYVLACGPIPTGLDVLHSCDNPSCVNPGHLRADTHTANMREMNAKGRRTLPRGDAHHSRLRPECMARGERNGARTHPHCIPRGESVGSSKLTAASVREIRAMRQRGDMLKTIAAAFGISTSTAHDVCRRNTWTHVGVAPADDRAAIADLDV